VGIARVRVGGVRRVGGLEDEVPEFLGFKVEQLRCTLVSGKAGGAVHVVPLGTVGFGEVGEIQVDHAVSGGRVDGSIDVVVAVVEGDGGVLDALDGVGRVGFDVDEDVAGGPGPGGGKDNSTKNDGIGDTEKG